MPKPDKQVTAEEVLDGIIEVGISNLSKDEKSELHIHLSTVIDAMNDYASIKVKEACEKQREKCVDALILLLEERPDIKIDVLHMNHIVDRINNAPSPE